ncbi:MAG TPA: hypothetical protein VKP30_08985 [Polyangiaceae bacterium]|nr:hypothetical protein [Polyangiaceae bacterium]
MFESKRLSTVGKQVALVGVTLLLLLVAGASQGRTSEAGSRLTAQVLRQVLRLGAHDLRRPNSAQTRTSKLEQSDPDTDRASTAERPNAGAACLHLEHTHPQPSYRLVSLYAAVSAANAPRQRCSEDVERARAPPTRA